MNFVKEIKTGFLNRWHIRHEIKTAKKEINSYGSSILGEGMNAKIDFTEKWYPFYSVFTITGTDFPPHQETFIQEWIDEIMDIDID